MSSYVTDRPDPAASVSDVVSDNNAPASFENVSTVETQNQLVDDDSAIVEASQADVSSQGPSSTVGLGNGMVTPEQLKPFPKAPKRKEGQKRRRTGQTQILTATPTKNEIEQEILNRKARPKPKSAGNKGRPKSQSLAKAKSVTERTNIRKSANDSDSDDSDEWPCLVCCEELNSGKPEDKKHIQCQECKKWAHLNCTADNPDGYYICENCNSDSEM